ncbi:hypothetical protein Hanom_Chr08g00706681 [Helianthus anomalus]
MFDESLCFINQHQQVFRQGLQQEFRQQQDIQEFFFFGGGGGGGFVGRSFSSDLI